MKTPPFRTLIVDDHEGFRRFLCVTLQEQTRCEVIGEACDGLEAVQKAEDLQPDLILLDLGLPILNGMQVARRVRKLCPHAKILIVSQDSSPDIVAGALRIGARGYLLKTDAANLPLAVESVLQDRVFLSSQLDGKNPRSVDPESPNKM
jgi:DNA-binding NarL/FixJ family response regulator